MGFNENILENTIVDEISSKGYEHVLGSNLSRKQHEDVLVEEDIRAFLKNK